MAFVFASENPQGVLSSYFLYPHSAEKGSNRAAQEAMAPAKVNPENILQTEIMLKIKIKVKILKCKILKPKLESHLSSHIRLHVTSAVNIHMKCQVAELWM